MPELKNTFTGGRMEKDLDERIVPRGLYREALNIDVSNSEDSDVGAIQNILGNLKVTAAIQGDTGDYVYTSTCNYMPSQNVNGRYYGTNYHIASVVNPQTDMLYRFVNTTPDDDNPHGVWMDRIVEYDTTRTLSSLWWNKEKSIFVDIYKIETKILNIDIPVAGCDQSIIEVCKNSFQLRWGMIIRGGTIPSDKDVFIEKVTYNGDLAVLTLSENIDAFVNANDNITFHGDRVLNFHPNRKITGINIIDDMLFWTDNYSEPKKVNIARDRVGSTSSFYGSGWDHVGGIPRTYGCGGANTCLSDFDQHTKLMVGGDNVARECNKKTAACPNSGCTNPLALNYDPYATIDDGSCTMPTYGCNDPLSCNGPGSTGYAGPFDFPCDAQAVLDGFCLATDECDDTSCKGCTDPTALNYDPSATIDDGSCSYGYTCTPAGFPQMTCDYTDNNGVDFPRTLLPTDLWPGGVYSDGWNYAGGNDFLDAATISNTTYIGRHFYRQTFNDALPIAPERCFIPNFYNAGGVSGQTAQFDDAVSAYVEEVGFYYGNNNDPNGTVYPDQTICNHITQIDLVNQTWADIITYFRDNWYFNGVVDPVWNANGVEILYSDNWSQVYSKLVNTGLAGSGWVADGCTNFTAGTIDFMLSFDFVNFTQQPACECYNADGSAPAVYNAVSQCTQDLTSLDDLATCQAGCITPLTHCQACQADPAACFNGTSVVFGCQDPLSLNYEPLADCPSSCTAIVNGCTDPLASNFNALANFDDGSCIYLGCIDPTALNFCATCNVDDGSCLYPPTTGCLDPTTYPLLGNSGPDNYDCLPGNIPASGNSCGDGVGTDDGVTCHWTITDCTDTLGTDNPFPITGGANNISPYLGNPQFTVNPCATCCTYDPPVFGCIDNTTVNCDGSTGAINYDAAAQIDDGSCTYITCVYGCMDSTADNYDPAANVNAISASDPTDPCCGFGCTDVNHINYDPNVAAHCSAPCNPWLGLVQRIHPKSNSQNECFTYGAGSYSMPCVDWDQDGNEDSTANGADGPSNGYIGAMAFTNGTGSAYMASKYPFKWTLESVNGYKGSSGATVWGSGDNIPLNGPGSSTEQLVNSPTDPHWVQIENVPATAGVGINFYYILRFTSTVDSNYQAGPFHISMNQEVYSDACIAAENCSSSAPGGINTVCTPAMITPHLAAGSDWFGYDAGNYGVIDYVEIMNPTPPLPGNAGWFPNCSSDGGSAATIGTAWAGGSTGVY